MNTWILKDHRCIKCDNMIIGTHANNDHADYYYYCSNKECEHHKGSEIFDYDKLEWAIEYKSPNYNNLLLTDQEYIKNLFTECSKIWGQEAQIQMVIGEIGELLSEFGKEVQGRSSMEKWVDEISDCIIMLNQFALIKNEKAIKNRIVEKIIKLENRLENSKMKIRELANNEIQKTIKENPAIYGKGNK